MVTAAAVATIIGAGAAVVGGIQSYRAGKEQRRQNAVSNRISATRRIRSIRAAIARGRVQRAEQQASGFSLGVGGGTAVAGGVAGTNAAVNSAITGSNQQFSGQQVIASSNNSISGFQSSASLAGAVGGIAGQFADPQAGAAVSNLFGFGA
jgi:hypothetical protein